MSWMRKIVTAYRFRAAIVLVGVVALLGTAVWLDPVRLEPHHRGYRYLPPCGILQRTGYPCPTCYMTRSFAYMMHGHPIRAFLAQPFGAALCLLVIYLGYGAVCVLITGQPWRPIWAGWPLKYVVVILIAAFLGGWIFRLIYGKFITGEFPMR